MGSVPKHAACQRPAARRPPPRSVVKHAYSRGHARAACGGHVSAACAGTCRRHVLHEGRRQRGIDDGARNKNRNLLRRAWHVQLQVGCRGEQPAEALCDLLAAHHLPHAQGTTHASAPRQPGGEPLPTCLRLTTWHARRGTRRASAPPTACAGCACSVCRVCMQRVAGHACSIAREDCQLLIMTTMSASQKH